MDTTSQGVDGPGTRTGYGAGTVYGAGSAPAYENGHGDATGPARGTGTGTGSAPAAPADPRRALGAFLRARRGRVAPEQVGLRGGGRRRVRGLRREELAGLAGISVDYYVRLEQGRATQPSPEVLGALARALGLDPAERRHLATLAGFGADVAAGHGTTPRTPAGPALRRVLDGMPGIPAYVTDHLLDVVAWNALGAELTGGLGDPGRRDRNQARYLFLDPASRDVHPDWADRAREAVGLLRVSAGRFPDDPDLAALITELSALSPEFTELWASGEVMMCAGGRKRFRHPLAGLLTLDYETLHVSAAPGATGLVVHVFTPEDDTPESAALTRLARTTTPLHPSHGS
ncbi:helix-turn-helix domain-containing protein [Streptomyces sp. MUM 203J]|uniref:helix-turn-helix transcriptional regulator n=1 Tax=Streptomyces sp. MUM 203J TaxID=2791990 RepID=UPI001F03F091|nr:helix-turn-helix transcriptional regulator [Streptomyces sp. MUM 203J]MCH0540192.1 helix-turn-helix domain-containing protein [Streptomyces sp. MUM 203J]